MTRSSNPCCWAPDNMAKRKVGFSDQDEVRMYNPEKKAHSENTPEEAMEVDQVPDAPPGTTGIKPVTAVCLCLLISLYPSVSLWRLRVPTRWIACPHMLCKARIRSANGEAHTLESDDEEEDIQTPTAYKMTDEDLHEDIDPEVHNYNIQLIPFTVRRPTRATSP